MSIQRFLLLISLPLWFLLFTTQAHANTVDTQLQNDAESLLHNLDYIAADYPGAVLNGEVVDAGEYGEQQEFAAQLSEVIKRLPDHAQKPALAAKIKDLQRAIGEHVASSAVTALCRDTSTLLIDIYSGACRTSDVSHNRYWPPTLPE